MSGRAHWIQSRWRARRFKRTAPCDWSLSNSNLTPDRPIGAYPCSKFKSCRCTLLRWVTPCGAVRVVSASASGTAQWPGVITSIAPGFSPRVSSPVSHYTNSTAASVGRCVSAHWAHSRSQRRLLWPRTHTPTTTTVAARQTNSNARAARDLFRHHNARSRRKRKKKNKTPANQ